MSDSKEIRIRAVLDASTFDKGISEIQEKIKKITQQQAQGQGAQQTLGKQGGIMGKYATQAFGDFSKESQQQMQKMYQAQKQEAMNQNITLKGQAMEIAKIAKLESDMTKQQKQRLDYLKQENELLKEKHRQTLSTAAETQKAIDKMAPVAGSTGGGPGGPGGGGGAGGATGGGDAMSSFSKALKAISVGAILKGGLNAATSAYEQFVVNRPRELEQFKGSAMQGAGREMRETFSGKGSNAAFYAQERSKAFGMAMKERNSRENLDLTRGVTGGAIGGVGGAMAGAYGGAMAGGYLGMGIGSLLGPAGTIVGGIAGSAIGGIAGGIGGGLAGGYAGAGSRGISAMFDRDKYNKMSISEMMQNREGIEASLIAQDPSKAFAREGFMQDYQGMAGFERSTGIRTNEGMYGAKGLLRTQMGVGESYGGGVLTEADVKGQTAAIYGAGGGTAGANMAGMAGTINRQFGMNNAGSIMGGLMGQGGLNTGQTQEATRRLMAEAVRAGVDASTMPQELERFTQVAAQLATAGGGYSENVASLMGAATVGTSAAQITAGAGAVQQYESAAKQSEGLEGSIGYGFLLGDKGKKAFGEKAINKIKKDPALMATLNQYSAEDLQKQDPAFLNGLADMLGMSPDELLKAKGEMDAEKQTKTVGTEEAMRALGKFKEGKTEAQLKAMSSGTDAESKEYRRLTAEANIRKTGESGAAYSAQGAAAREAGISLTAAATAGTIGGAPAAGLGAIDLQMGVAQTSAAEKQIASQGKGEMERINNMNKHLDAFGVAAEKSSIHAAQFAFMLEKVDKALTENGPKMQQHLETINSQLEKFSDSMAQQGYQSTKPK